MSLVLVGAASHGLSYAIGKQGVARVDVVTFSLYRSGAGALLLAIAVLLSGQWRSFQDAPAIYLGLALAGACLNFWTMLGFFWALRLGSLSLMGPLHMSYPLFVFLFGMLFLNETVSLLLFTGAAAIFSGIIVLSAAQEGSRHGPPDRNKAWASFLALSSSLSWGASLVIDKAVLAYLPAMVLNLVKIGIPCLGFYLLVRLKGPVPRLRGEDLARAVASGLLGLVAANLLYFYALRQTQAVWVAPLSSTSMLFSVFFAVLLIRERPRLIHLLATALIFVGVWLVRIG